MIKGTLHSAALQGRIDILNGLLAKGVSVNELDERYSILFLQLLNK